MTIRRPPALAPEVAEDLAGALLDRAIERARVTNAEVALAIGYAESGEKHVREMRAGTRAFTLRHFALLTVSCPRLAAALVAELGALLTPDPGATQTLYAVQSASLAGAELARVGICAAMDASIDESERRSLRVQSGRVRSALDVLDASLAQSSSKLGRAS